MVSRVGCFTHGGASLVFPVRETAPPAHGGLPKRPLVSRMAFSTHGDVLFEEVGA